MRGTMMNMSSVLRYIEAKLGYRLRDIEIDDQEIIDAIKHNSLPTFSAYFPCQYRKLIKHDTDMVDGYNNRYYIDSTDPNEDYQILGVSQIYLGNIINYGYDPNLILGNSSGTGFGSILRKATQAPMNPIVFEYIPPNQVEIRPNSYRYDFIAELKIVHPDHLQTIHPGLSQHFMDLCLYDTKIYLWNMRNRFSELQTPFGTINLNLDVLQEGFDQRRDLLEMFRRYMGKGWNRKRIWVG